MLYRATYYGPHTPDGHSYETRILPTLRAVELWAETKLKDERIETTRDCYHRDVGRAPSVTYRQVTRFKGAVIDSVLVPCGGKRGEIFPPITIVPSVGEFRLDTMMIHIDILVQRLHHERERLAIAKSNATRCTHPDDLVTFAAVFKAHKPHG